MCSRALQMFVYVRDAPERRRAAEAARILREEEAAEGCGVWITQDSAQESTVLLIRRCLFYCLFY